LAGNLAARGTHLDAVFSREHDTLLQPSRHHGQTGEVDTSRYFESERVAVRGVMRVGFGFPHPGAVARITFTTGA
jgi:hypothetical protein